jgi:hypothetical protein
MEYNIVSELVPEHDPGHDETTLQELVSSQMCLCCCKNRVFWSFLIPLQFCVYNLPLFDGMHNLEFAICFKNTLLPGFASLSFSVRLNPAGFVSSDIALWHLGTILCPLLLHDANVALVLVSSPGPLACVTFVVFSRLRVLFSWPLCLLACVFALGLEDDNWAARIVWLVHKFCAVPNHGSRFARFGGARFTRFDRAFRR